MTNNKRCSRGRWNIPGVPHKGWLCVEVYVSQPETRTCEMCRSSKARFVHVMRHPDYPDDIAVGRICASHMEEDYRMPRRREAQLERRLAQEALVAVGRKAA